MVVLYWLRTPSFIFSTSTVFFNFLIFYYLLFFSVFFYVEMGVLLPHLSGCVCLLWNLLPFQSVRVTVTVAASLCLRTRLSFCEYRRVCVSTRVAALCALCMCRRCACVRADRSRRGSSTGAPRKQSTGAAGRTRGKYPPSRWRGRGRGRGLGRLP